MVIAYVDGSFTPKFGYPTYGIYMISDNGIEYKYRGQITDESMTGSRQIAGELIATIVAINNAIKMGHKKIEIRYDYAGIEKFATGEWKAKNHVSQWYVNKFNKLKNKIEIVFTKIEAHTGDKGNEIADQLAKSAAH